MPFYEIILMSLRSIRANILRAILTLMIIAFGIMALVGILTAIDSIVYALNDNFSGLGANSFSIEPKDQNRNRRERGVMNKKGEVIRYDQALDFKDRFNFGGKVSVVLDGTGLATVKFLDKKTNPNIGVVGIDENYLSVKGYDLEIGRSLTELEASNGGAVTLVGADIVKTLFNKKPELALNKIIIVGNVRYKIIGVLKSKGSGLSGSEDRRVLIPLFTAKRFYETENSNYSILVSVSQATQMEEVIANSTGLFRIIRKLKPGIADDFEIFKSDGLIDILKENTVMLRSATVAIGLITLIGAAIGLMNIMLVSVTERTREIGICKSLGATRRTILTQFLTEAVLICQMGGIVGIILGILVGNVVSFTSGSRFYVPWGWMLLGIVVCMVVGLLSGLYPALKASRLDPIESLRYE
ncbi:MAG: ABC transporter permease [Saprospiraceae bacterium]|nr:ABC transporter permease [Saprospiraceae bacterium]